MVAGIADIGEHAPGIAAMVGFGKAKTAQPFPAGQLGEILNSLIFTAILINREHDQGALDACRRADAAVAPFEFLHHQAIADIIQSASAILFGDGRTETAHLTGV